MKKELFSSVFRSNSKKTDVLDTKNSALFPDIPFFGKKGTICRIEETNSSYNKVIYNYDGTINPIKIATPKRKGKNLSAVTEEYYKDLKKYLDCTNNEYMNCKNNRLHKNINKKQVKGATIASIIIAILSFPIWFSSVQSVSYIGAILEATSLFSLYVTYDLKKAMRKDEEKKKFIEQYNRYQEKLVTYNQKRAQNIRAKQTQYTEISSREATTALENSKAKTKILIKEESEAA